MTGEINITEEVTEVDITEEPQVEVTIGDVDVDVTITEEPQVEVTVTEENVVVIVYEHTEEVEQVPRKTLLDDVGGGISYLGKATPGAATSDAVWQIQRITEGEGIIGPSGDDLIVEWAESNANSDKIWDNRAAYSYG